MPVITPNNNPASVAEKPASAYSSAIQPNTA